MKIFLITIRIDILNYSKYSTQAVIFSYLEIYGFESWNILCVKVQCLINWSFFKKNCNCMHVHLAHYPMTIAIRLANIFHWQDWTWHSGKIMYWVPPPLHIANTSSRGGFSLEGFCSRKGTVICSHPVCNAPSWKIQIIQTPNLAYLPQYELIKT